MTFYNCFLYVRKKKTNKNSKSSSKQIGLVPFVKIALKINLYAYYFSHHSKNNFFLLILSLKTTLKINLYVYYFSRI